MIVGEERLYHLNYEVIKYLIDSYYINDSEINYIVRIDVEFTSTINIEISERLDIDHTYY